MPAHLPSMRMASYFGAGAIVVGVAAFNFSDRTENSVHVVGAIVDAVEPVDSTPPAIDSSALRASQQIVPIPTRQPAARSATNTRGRGGQRSRRFRNVNRYPGPIPTPADWAPPEGPVRIALQAGHWKADEAPPELSGLKDNGTHGGGKAEWEVNLAIAERTAVLLKAKGYEVDILPAVVPPGYRAHLFIAIHADGAADTRATGYRVAAPGRDATGRAGRMVTTLQDSYGKATGLRRLPDVTRRMENYYAFNFRRYEHALHPMTIAVILETGFLTSPSDRAIIVNNPDRVARGIVDAVMAFPETQLPDSARK